MAMRSSKVLGWSSRRYFCMPGDSNWKVPTVRPVAIEVVSGGIFDVEQVDVDFNAERVADVFDGFAQDRQCFETEEVHLDESGFLDDLTFVLGAVEFFAGFLVVGCADGYPIADVVAADDEATGVHTGIAHVASSIFAY